MYARILLAVDLADDSPEPKGLKEAMALVELSKGALRLVFVQPMLPATFLEYVPADFDAEQERRAQESLAALAARIALPPERLSSSVATGGIYHELLREAADGGADLLVVGSHRPVMSDYLLGSNAKTIVAHAPCSVLVVRPGVAAT